MQSSNDATTRSEPTHPRCPDCKVPMWMVHIEHTFEADIRHFECKSCGHKVARPDAVAASQPRSATGSV